jgi:hypothetical protein
MNADWKDIYTRARGDILYFCELLNFKPMDHQREVLLAIQKGERFVAIRSGQGPGKTTITAVVALWRTFRAFKALTIISAPSVRQCRDQFLAECARLLMQAHPYLQKFIEVTKSRVIVGQERDWEIKVATATRSANISGYHQPNMTFIFDEAQGIPDDIFVTAEGTLSNPDCLFMAIGNPTVLNNAFHRCFTAKRGLWKCFVFNAEKVAEQYPTIVSPARNKRLEEQYGRESDVFRSRVLGEFPNANSRSPIDLPALEAAMVRPALDARSLSPVKAFGIDLAAYGDDESVIYRREGLAIVEEKFFRSTDPAQVIRHAIRMQHLAGWTNQQCVYVFDIGGMGMGVRHILDEAKVRYIPFNFGGTACDCREYANKATEALFTFARRLKAGNISLPHDDHLAGQLIGRLYDLDPKSRLRLESKQAYSERTKAGSPDRADALVMAFYSDVMGTGRVTKADGGMVARPTLGGSLGTGGGIFGGGFGF